MSLNYALFLHSVSPSLRGFLLKAQPVIMEIFMVCFQKPMPTFALMALISAPWCFLKELSLFLVAPNDGMSRSGLCCLCGTHQSSSSILLSLADPDNPGLGPSLAWEEPRASLAATKHF